GTTPPDSLSGSRVPAKGVRKTHLLRTFSHEFLIAFRANPVATVCVPGTALRSIGFSKFLPAYSATALFPATLHEFKVGRVLAEFEVKRNPLIFAVDDNVRPGELFAVPKELLRLFYGRFNIANRIATSVNGNCCLARFRRKCCDYFTKPS